MGNTPRAGIAAASVLVVLALLSLSIGVDDLDFAHLFEDTHSLQLVWISRLPRTLAALLAGAGLAIAGLIMQTLARNRFVEPSMAGTAQSAEFGLLLVTIVWPSAPLALQTLIAAAAAIVGTSVFLATAHRLPPTQPYLVPLFGIVYGGVIGAAGLFVAWQSDLLQFIAIWTSGDFSGVLRGRYELLWCSAALVVFAVIIADRLTILSLGRDATIGLGIDFHRLMQIGLIIVSLISALTVVVIGMIPFVGLVVPNIVSRLMGDNLRLTLPWVAASGAGLVLSCDIIGRVIRFPYEIPVGTVMGVIGATVLLWLMFKRGANG